MPTSKRPRARLAIARAETARNDGRRVRLHPHGLELAGGEVLPLFAGAMHYWRNAPDEWAAGLDAMKAIGLCVLDTYVPWGIHEVAPGDFDFGVRDPKLDLVRLLELAHEHGLQLVLLTH